MQRWNKFKEKIKQLRVKRRVQVEPATENKMFTFALPTPRDCKFQFSFQTSNGGGTYFISNQRMIGMNDTDSQGIATLADAIRDGHLQKIEELELTNCRINDDDVVNLMNIIITTTHKQFKAIDLSESKIGDKAAFAIAEALKSGCFPDEFKLNLYKSKIGDDGAAAIAKALTHTNCPSRLWLRLEDNKITATGAEVIKDIYINIQRKRDIQMYFSNFKDKSMLHITNEIRGLQNNYHKSFDALLCLTFYLGLSDAESPISRLNRNIDVMRIICSHVFQTKVHEHSDNPKNKSLVANKSNLQHPSLLFANRVHEFYKQQIRDNPQRLQY